MPSMLHPMKIMLFHVFHTSRHPDNYAERKGRRKRAEKKTSINSNREYHYLYRVMKDLLLSPVSLYSRQWSGSPIHLNVWWLRSFSAGSKKIETGEWSQSTIKKWIRSRLPKIYQILKEGKIGYRTSRSPSGDLTIVGASKSYFMVSDNPVSSRIHFVPSNICHQGVLLFINWI